MTNPACKISITAQENPPESQNRRNLFDMVLAPQMMTLKILGFGENNFTSWFIRCLYNFYFVCIIGSCMAAAYYTYFRTIIQALHSQRVENMLDGYVYWSDEFVWVYELFIVLIFLIWAIKWKKITSIFRLLDEKRFGFLSSMNDDPFVRNRSRKLIAGSYISLFVFVTIGLVWPVINFVVKGLNQRIVLYSSSVFPSLIIYICVSFSMSMYLCTAELWNIFLYSLKKKGDSQASSEAEDDFEDIVEEYASRYDALSELTSVVAGTFRYYATIHLCAFLSIINLLYQTVFDHSFLPVYIVYNWIDIFLHLIPFFAASMVYTYSSQTVHVLHTVYKQCRHGAKNKNIQSIDTEHRSLTDYYQPSAAYIYFYQYVASERACLSLDVAGLIAMTKTTTAVFLFAAANWCAVIMQFRQGNNSCSDTNVMSNGTNITSQH